MLLSDKIKEKLDSCEIEMQGHSSITKNCHNRVVLLKEIIPDIEKLERINKELTEVLEMYADEMFYFPRSLILLAQEKGIKVAPCYSEFGKRAKETIEKVKKELNDRN
jgi:hypothetical protein